MDTEGSASEGSGAERCLVEVIRQDDAEVWPHVESLTGISLAPWLVDRMEDRGALQVIRNTATEIARLQALQVHAVARLSTLRGQSRGIAPELALTLSTTEHAAQTQVGMVEALTTRLPATLAAMESGAVDAHKAGKVVDATAALDDEKAREADTLLADRLPGKTPTGIRQAAARAVHRVDPDGAAARARARREERRVELVHQDDGMSSLVADLPVEVATSIYARVDRRARALRVPGEVRTLDQLRADVFADLCLCDGVASAAAPNAEVFVYISAASLAGVDDRPAEIAGHGPVPAEIARQIAHDPNATWRRILTDPATGHPTDLGRSRYRPPVALDEFVRVRDRVCRMPGCQRPAHFGDLDHTTEWARGGHTTERGLIGYCRRHHRLKDEPGWTYRVDGTGTLHVTTPAGDTYRSAPDPLGEPVAEHTEPDGTDDDAPPPF